MEVKYISVAGNQPARAIAAVTVKACDRRIERGREPISAAVARDLEACLMDAAQRPESGSVWVTERSWKHDTVVSHRRELQIARLQAHDDSNLRPVADSIRRRASTVRYAPIEQAIRGVKEGRCVQAGRKGKAVLA